MSGYKLTLKTNGPWNRNSVVPCWGKIRFALSYHSHSEQERAHFSICAWDMGTKYTRTSLDLRKSLATVIDS